MLKKGILALLSIAVALLMPACGHKDTQGRKVVTETEVTTYKEKKAAKPKEAKPKKAKQVKQTKTEKKTKDSSGKEMSTKTQTKEVMPQMDVDYDESDVDMDEEPDYMD